MMLVVNLAKNRSPDALQGEPKSPTQTLAVKTINSEQIYQQNCPQRSLRTLTLSSIIIIILPYHLVIIINRGSSSTSRSIIISTIFIIIASTSSPLSLSSSSSSLQSHLYHHHHHRRRRRHRYYNCLEQKHVEKEVEYMPDSVGHHCYFYFTIYKNAPAWKRAKF